MDERENDLGDRNMEADPALQSVEQLTALNRRAMKLRAQYARQGMTVYDRLDRWQDEHRGCGDGDHDPAVEQAIYVIHCRPTGSVAVCESWQFTSHA
jgi:hypothetical protein